MTKKKVLLFARSFLAKYYSDIKSEIIEPIFVTLTHEEKCFLECKGWKVYGCFEDEYSSLSISGFPGNYLRTSFQSDRFLNRFSHKKREEILGKEITFWARIMDTIKPDFLVNETVAVEIAEVMAIEAQKRSIPFYTYLLGFLPNTFYWKPDPFTGRLDSLEVNIPSEEQLCQATDYIKGVVEKNNRPFYVSNIKKHTISGKTVLHSWIIYKRKEKEEKQLSSKVDFRYEDYSIFTYNDYLLYKSALKGYYDNVNDIDGKEIVFYPMHVEPEATLNYFVEENYEQCALINNILSSIKQNQYLVVKEHPQQQGALLQSKYQNLRKYNKNLILLPSYIKSFDILNICSAIVTLTSSAAWEGLLLGKPVFIMGTIFFDQCTGVKRVDSLKQLKQELQKEKYDLPDKKKLCLFAAKMINFFHEGCPTPDYKNSTIDAFVKAMEEL